jgi:hypothetical protein
LRRDFQACIEYADLEVRQYGLRNQKLVDAFTDKCRERKEAMAAGDDVWRAACQADLDKLQEKLTESAKNAPSSFSKAKNIGVRLTEFPFLYFTCDKYPEVEPTNNAAERAVRPVAIARRVNIGSESLHGTTMFNIMRSIFGTCQAKGINPDEFLVDALNRFKRGLPLPSLVNIGKAVDQKYAAQAEQERKDLGPVVPARSRTDRPARDFRRPTSHCLLTENSSSGRGKHRGEEPWCMAPVPQASRITPEGRHDPDGVVDSGYWPGRIAFPGDVGPGIETEELPTRLRSALTPAARVLGLSQGNRETGQKGGRGGKAGENGKKRKSVSQEDSQEDRRVGTREGQARGYLEAGKGVRGEASPTVHPGQAGDYRAEGSFSSAFPHHSYAAFGRRRVSVRTRTWIFSRP